jgi:glycosyltransferase involved in cell wall biosynthesis
LKPVVLFLVDSLQTGGAEQSLLEILKGFSEFRPIVVVAFRGRSDLEPAYTGAGISVVHLGLNRSLSFRKLARQALPVIRDLNPALIHSTLFYSDMLARRLKPLVSVPLVNSIVNDTYGKRRYRLEPLPVKIKLFVVRLIDSWSVKAVDRFIANSETIAGSISRALGVSRQNITVIPRARAVDTFLKVDETMVNDLRRTLQLNDKRIFLHAGRMIRRKGHADLLHAFKILADNYSDVVLLLAGDGPELEELLRLSEKLGLNGKVIFLGNRKDVPVLMKAADFFIFPSYYEGLPGVLVEAMLARLPVVASDIPENKEILDEALFSELKEVNLKCFA